MYSRFFPHLLSLASAPGGGTGDLQARLKALTEQIAQRPSDPAPLLQLAHLYAQLWIQANHAEAGQRLLLALKKLPALDCRALAPQIGQILNAAAKHAAGLAQQQMLAELKAVHAELQAKLRAPEAPLPAQPAPAPPAAVPAAPAPAAPAQPAPAPVAEQTSAEPVVEFAQPSIDEIPQPAPAAKVPAPQPIPATAIAPPVIPVFPPAPPTLAEPVQAPQPSAEPEPVNAAQEAAKEEIFIEPAIVFAEPSIEAPTLAAPVIPAPENIMPAGDTPPPSASPVVFFDSRPDIQIDIDEPSVEIVPTAAPASAAEDVVVFFNPSGTSTPAAPPDAAFSPAPPATPLIGAELIEPAVPKIDIPLAEPSIEPSLEAPAPMNNGASPALDEVKIDIADILAAPPSKTPAAPSPIMEPDAAISGQPSSAPQPEMEIDVEMLEPEIDISAPPPALSAPKPAAPKPAASKPAEPKPTAPVQTAEQKAESNRLLVEKVRENQRQTDIEAAALGNKAITEVKSWFEMGELDKIIESYPRLPAGRVRLYVVEELLGRLDTWRIEPILAVMALERDENDLKNILRLLMKADKGKLCSLMEIRSYSPDLQKVAVMMLAEMNSRVTLQRLEEALDSEDPIVRAVALSGIGRLGAVANRTIPRVADLLREDANPGVRMAAAQSLSQMHTQPALEALEKECAKQKMDPKILEIRDAMREKINSASTAAQAEAAAQKKAAAAKKKENAMTNEQKVMIVITIIILTSVSWYIMKQYNNYFGGEPSIPPTLTSRPEAGPNFAPPPPPAPAPK